MSGSRWSTAHIVALSAALIVATPGVAFAAEGGFWKGAAWSAANFVILGAVFVVLLRKRVKSGLESRRSAILTELGEAARLREDAAARAKEIDDKVAALDGDIARLVAEFTAEGERAKKRLIDEASKQAERMRADAEASMAQEIERERRRLRDEVVANAVRLAEEILRSEVKDADRERLAREYVDRFRAAVGGVK